MARQAARRAADRRAARLDHAAGDAVAGVAGRIGLVVVRLGVDHQRRAVIVEQRVRLALFQRDRRVHDLDRKLAALRHVQVRHVAGMALAGHHAVLVVARIEMRAGGFERRFALADGMNVEGVLARRQALDLQLDQDAGGGLHQVDVADGLAAGILELGVGHFGGDCGRHRDGRGQQGGGAGRPEQLQNTHGDSPWRDIPPTQPSSRRFEFHAAAAV